MVGDLRDGSPLAPLLILGIIVTLSFDESVLSRVALLSTLEYKTAAPTRSGVNLSACVLPDLDPWDPASLRLVNPGVDPLKNCKPTVVPITSLEEGELRLNESLIPKSEQGTNYACIYRCLLPKNDWKMTMTKWTRIEDEKRPKCDVVEVSCGSNPKQWSYRYLHHQIYVERVRSEKTTAMTHESSTETPPVTTLDSSTTSNPENGGNSEIPKLRQKRSLFGTTEQQEGIENPDVLLLVVDSVSSSSMVRALQSTIHLLREEFDAVVFRHLNKVGLNSRPNGFAFLAGKQIYNIKKNPYSNTIHADLSHKEWCKEALDNQSFVSFAFRNAGYKTMMAEDWAHGVFNWPNCTGFTGKPVDHYMRPYQIRLRGSANQGGDHAMNEIVFRKSCREPHNSILDYTGQFLKAYEDRPKFAFSWMTDIAHDKMSQLYHVDKHFYRFFYDNREKLRNSFIIVMGDHGMRFGRYRNSKFGVIEDNNPALVMAIPKKLRKAELTQILKENSKSMITHYDVFATLNDIASVLSESRFTDFSPLDLNERLEGVFHGSSLLRPLPQPRHCGNLRVPFEFCTCEVKYRSFPPTHEFFKAAEKFLIDGLNAEIEAANASELCVPLTLKPHLSLLEEVTSAENLFQITVIAKPSLGKFSSLISVSRKEDGSLEIEKINDEFSRLNSYKGHSDCTSSARIRPICFCKNQVNKKVGNKETKT
ncbi:hypothetical protein L596_027839 [Steinernema carpocapsae]|uniref:Uncharacterized protein n=1 Tax=Steinernema carpocapsae TaxID=34508 RepID=A0A4U5LWQ2_STECR|nr:hypothetical protein L596_027839 [Steinernema carpocapsae]